MAKNVEELIMQAVDENAERIYRFCDDIYCHGEPGYFEYRTAKEFQRVLEELGLEPETGLARTGVKATLEMAGGEGPTIGLLGELDGVHCPGHPHANPENGISHTCGHHIQLGAVLGAAMALNHPEIKKHLSGRVAFLAVPAEEYIPSQVKDELKESGEIHYTSGGKSEWLRLGAFEGIDVVTVHHAHTSEEDEKDIRIGMNTSNGFISKKITVKGKATHAAASPHKGVNALNAALLGLQAVNSLRETFRDEDCVRVHPIIKEGGGVVNVIPDHVVVETMVRANHLDAILAASRKVDQAFRGTAYALGAEAEITDYPGYLPTLYNAPPRALRQAVDGLGGEVTCEEYPEGAHTPGSTDVGDLTHLMPVINFTTGGISGSLHGADFSIEDRYKAYIVPAKIMALTVYHLLKDDAGQAKELLAGFTPAFTIEDYINYKEMKFLKDEEK